ncbi:hypothetical protein HanRHA438_Chr05g0212301 [Helianthus annuus]|nr:hypothetical protein HanRHA438_Chr05g0212301 [Helianthus annuus]
MFSAILRSSGSISQQSGCPGRCSLYDSDTVTLIWKKKRFKVWVREEEAEWIPDCLLSDNWPESPNGDKDGESTQLGSFCLVDEWREVAEELKLHGEVDKEQLAVNDKGIPEVNLEGSNIGGQQLKSFCSFEKVGRVKKKPFNILKDKHLPRPKSVSPTLHNRPKKRTRSELEKPSNTCWFSRPFLKSDKVNNMCQEDYTRDSLENSGEERIQQEAMSGDKVNTRSVNEEPEICVVKETLEVNMEEAREEELLHQEIETTINLGAAVGAKLGVHNSLVKETILKEGNNGVKI